MKLIACLLCLAITVVGWLAYSITQNLGGGDDGDAAIDYNPVWSMAKTRERRKESKTITGKSRSVQDHEAESGYPGAGTAAAAVELLISGSRRQIRLLPVCCLFPSLQKSPLVVWKTVRLSQSTHCSTRLGTYIKSEPGAARCC